MTNSTKFITYFYIANNPKLNGFKSISLSGVRNLGWSGCFWFIRDLSWGSAFRFIDSWEDWQNSQSVARGCDSSQWSVKARSAPLFFAWQRSKHRLPTVSSTHPGTVNEDVLLLLPVSHCDKPGVFTTDPSLMGKLGAILVHLLAQV